MKIQYLALLICLILSCKTTNNTSSIQGDVYDEAAIIAQNKEHENPRMRYKLIHSKVLDKKKIQKELLAQLDDFSAKDYEDLRPFIYEQDIRSIQKSIVAGKLSYKKLTQWYLYRINLFEFNPSTTLNTIISINPSAVEQAALKDIQRSNNQHEIYGMPILLKDNIDAVGMPTTAGAIALKNNMKPDAFIVEQLKSKGAIILGKVNLSEWAYYFCSGCPVGYSAIGGQTLNPYGPAVFESGGSSSGSGTSMAANYAVAAVGTETSGSILSPSSQNSIVGLKPTVGLLSRNGIVPISSTLDTPGPMTRSVVDNAIMLSAMVGKDDADPATSISLEEVDYIDNLTRFPLVGMRIGANKKYMTDVPLYAEMIISLQKQGAEIFGFEPKEVELKGFRTILNLDMRNDLPKYLSSSAKAKVKSVQDVIEFNEKKMDIRAPYEQELFDGIVADTTSSSELEKIIAKGKSNARSFFDEPLEEFTLDAIASINNYDAGRAALAHYPALTIPMGYKASGEPMNFTLIAPSWSESRLLQIGYAVEQATQRRVPPKLKD